jgi:hypothetical protein
MKPNPIELLKEIDLLNEKITNLEKEKHSIFQKLAFIKKQIEKEHEYLIGKKAICTHLEHPKAVECICTAVVAKNDYTGVKPLFSRNGKKYIVDEYIWL